MWGSQMNRNTNDSRDVEILLYTNRIFVTNSTKRIFRGSGFALKVTPDFYNFLNYILSYMMYTKYIIICVIIYSLACVLNFILFAGRLYFVDVTSCIKVLANETGKFMSLRSEEANLRLLKKFWKA